MNVARAFSVLRPRKFVSAARRLVRWVVGAERLVTRRAWGHLALRLGAVLLIAAVALRLFDELTWAFREQVYAGGQVVEWIVGTVLFAGVIIVVLWLLLAVLASPGGEGTSASKQKPAVSPSEEPAPKPSLTAFHRSVDAPLSLPAAAMPPVARQARAAQQQAPEKGRR